MSVFKANLFPVILINVISAGLAATGLYSAASSNDRIMELLGGLGSDIQSLTESSMLGFVCLFVSVIGFRLH